MKILHCADLHLDSKLSSNFDSKEAKTRRNEILNTFERMVDYAIKSDIDVILIAGDLFDTQKISALTKNTVLKTIDSNKDISFYYLKGNHDQDNFLTGLSSVPENLYLFDDEWKRFDIGNISIYGLELNDANSKMAYVSLQPMKDRFNIVMLHGQEALTDAKDKTEVINLKALKGKNIDYLALGHIHSQKVEKLDERGLYCYSGCLEGRGFDECGDCGFAVINIDETTHQFTHEFVDIAYRHMHHLKVDVSSCINSHEMIEAIDNKISLTNIDEKDLVRIELIGSIDVAAEKDTDFIKEHYKREFYYVQIKDSTSLFVDEMEYIHDESLKGEFIRLVMADDSISKEDRAAIVRYGIMVLSGEEVI